MVDPQQLLRFLVAGFIPLLISTIDNCPSSESVVAEPWESHTDTTSITVTDNSTIYETK